MLMNKKELYTSPEVETLVVRFEGVICQSTTGESVNEQTNWGGLGDWTDGE